MNKYLDSINNIKKCLLDKNTLVAELQTLEELANRETGIKPIAQRVGIGDEGHLAGYAGVEYYCPSCDNLINDENWNPCYCECCGQALDWSSYQ